MNKGIIYTGIPSEEELANCPGVPCETRLLKGRVAVIECVQDIPCNPCEAACKFGAITIGENITNLPHLDGEKCTGCGSCIAQCPGLAITIVDKTYSDSEAVIEFPFEYLPLPTPDQSVETVGRDGSVLCKGRVTSVRKPAAYAGTAVVGIAIPKEFADQVRSMKRLK